VFVRYEEENNSNCSYSYVERKAHVIGMFPCGEGARLGDVVVGLVQMSFLLIPM
jgi:hypothetical protein